MNEPIGFTTCGGNDHNADECKRFAGEREAISEIRQRALELYEPPFQFHCGYIQDAKHRMVADQHEGPDSLRVRGWGRISCMEEPEKLQDEVGALIAEALTEKWQARAAQPAPAQGQQVECQECERLARQVKHWKDLAVANRKVADEDLAEIAASDQALRESRANDLTTMATLADVRAELSALKAQQVGQEPVLWARQCDLDESDPALFVSRERVEESGYTVPFYPHPTNSVEGEPVGYTTTGMLAIAKELPLTGRIGARCKADERWNVPLYTAPQPAPAQDVAGSVEALSACRSELHAMITAHNVQSEHDGSWLYDYQTVSEADEALADWEKTK